MKKGLLVFFLLLIGFIAKAQDGEPFTDRIYFGGNLGLQFGTITNIEVAPIVGYRITHDFSAGIGITYIYYKADYDYFEVTSNIYGGRVFARRTIGENFFLHGEYESLNLDVYDISEDRIAREWVPGLFLGGGYFQPVGNKLGVSVLGLYNVIYDDDKSPYNSPWVIRVGFTVGLFN